MGQSKTNTESSGVDSTQAGRQAQIWGAGNALAKQDLAPMDPSIARAQAAYGQQMQGGNLGMQALSGDSGAVSQLMNPYTQNVTDAVNAQYGHEAGNIINESSARAGAAGAFGGSRGAVVQGTGLAQLGQQQALTIAQLQQQGYTQAQAQAQVLAGMGQNATGASAQLGQYQTQQGQMAQSHALDTLGQTNAMAGSHGGTDTKTQSGDLLGDVVNLGKTAASFFSPGAGSMSGASAAGNNAINNSDYLKNLNTSAANINIGNLGYGNSGLGG